MPYQFNPLTGNFDLVNPQLTGSEIKTLYEGENNTNAFTDIEKSKLTGLDSANYATASQGVKADNSVQLTGDQTVAGIKTFTSPLILPNNSRINGVEHFYQSTKPVTRGDGSALVAGDRWYNTTANVDCFFNGLNWLGLQVYNVQGQVFGAASSNNYFAVSGEAIVFSDRNSIFVEKVQVVWEYSGYTPSNYWQLQVNIDRSNIFPPATTVLLNTYTTATNGGVYEQDVNTVYTFTSDYPIGVRLWAVKVGTPGALYASEGYRYRLVY